MLKDINNQSLIRNAIPIILGQLGTVLMAFTDTVMLGWLGKEEVAAIGVANQVFFVITVLGMGCMVALTSMVANSRGACRFEECGEYLRSGIELGFLLGVVLMSVLAVFTENFHWFHQAPEITLKSQTFLRILNISVIPLMLFMALKQYSDGLSLSKAAMVITFIGVILNILLNWVLIFGLFTFPAMGIKGSAIATLLCRIFMAIAMVFVVFYSKKYKAYLPPRTSTFKTRPIIFKLISIGIPTGLQLFFEVGAFAAAAVLVGMIGPVELAAHQIVLAYAALTYMLSSGLSSAGSVQVGIAYGQKNYTLLEKKAKNTLRVVIGFMCFTAIIFIVGQNVLPGLFIKDLSVIHVASILIIIAAFFQLSDGIQAVSLGLLRGIEDVKIPTFITLGVYWLFALPLSYILGFVFEYKVYGIWMGLLGGLTFSALFLTLRFWSKVNAIKSPKTISDVVAVKV